MIKWSCCIFLLLLFSEIVWSFHLAFEFSSIENYTCRQCAYHHNDSPPEQNVGEKGVAAIVYWFMDYCYYRSAAFRVDFANGSNGKLMDGWRRPAWWISVFSIHYVWSHRNKKKTVCFFQAVIKDHRLMDAHESTHSPSRTISAHETKYTSKHSIVQFILSATGTLHRYGIPASDNLIGVVAGTYTRYHLFIIIIIIAMVQALLLWYHFMYSTHCKNVWMMAAVVTGSHQIERKQKHTITNINQHFLLSCWWTTTASSVPLCTTVHRTHQWTVHNSK